jgi:hypothetical protein
MFDPRVELAESHWCSACGRRGVDLIRRPTVDLHSLTCRGTYLSFLLAWPVTAVMVEAPLDFGVGLCRRNPQEWALRARIAAA